MSNWYKTLTAQNTPKPLFRSGDDVVVDAPGTGIVTGTVSSAYDYEEGEWQYQVMVDDLMQTISVAESNMEIDD